MKSIFTFTVIIYTLITISCTKEETLNQPNSSNRGSQPQVGLIERYKDLTVIDIHNHDAESRNLSNSYKIWDEYNIDKIVLFGAISEPKAMESDKHAFEEWKQNPERIIPFIAGINIYDSTCLDYIKTNFENGCAGIGEVAAASTYSPVVSTLDWKAEHPMDGYFPEIYDLCAEYNKPILLHIDPPHGFVIDKLREAAEAYPNTNFIFAHANAYNSPQNIEDLLESSSNIYIDFFAGFTAYNPDSEYTLNDFIPVIEKFPNRFMVSSDSGFGIEYSDAYEAIYELIDLLSVETRTKVASENFLKLYRIHQ